MDMSTINEDCLEHLVSYLSIQNVLQCSLVNIAWRQAFNKDRFWKGKCVKYGLIDTIHHLCKTPCQVEPKFVIPQTTSKQLEQICEWRVNYMRVQHLMRNWINGNFEVCQRIHHFDSIDTIEMQDNLLFVYQYKSCIVLNVVSDPFVVTRFEMCFDTRVRGPLTFENGRLVIIQFNLLQVYKLSGISFLLDYRRILNDTEASTVEIPEKISIAKWNMKLFHHHKIVDDILVSLEEEEKGLGDDPLTKSYYKFHIWNLDTGKKLSEFKWETGVNRYISDIKLSKLNTREIMIALTHLQKVPYTGNKYDTTIYIHNFNTSSLKLHCHLGYNRLVAMPKNNVYIERRRKDGCLLIRNYLTGEVLTSLYVGLEYFNCYNFATGIILEASPLYKLVYNKKMLNLSSKKCGAEDNEQKYELGLCGIDSLKNELPLHKKWVVKCIEKYMTKMVLKNWEHIKILYFW